MEPRRLGGAFLTAFATGVGVMAPYTLPTIAPPLLAVIWSALVFIGIIGLVLALKPGGNPPAASGTIAHPERLKRQPFFDPELGEMLRFFVGMALLFLGFVAFMIIMQILVRVPLWLSEL